MTFFSGIVDTVFNGAFSWFARVKNVITNRIAFVVTMV